MKYQAIVTLMLFAAAHNAIAAVPDFPNLPNGLTLISDVTFDNVTKRPPASTTIWDANRWQIAGNAPRITVGSATAAGCANAPYGDQVLQGLFPVNFNGGSGIAPFKMVMQFDNNGTVSNKMYTKLWMCLQAGWENVATPGQICPGTKFGFFDPVAPGGPKHHLFWSFNTPAPYSPVVNRMKWGVSSAGPTGLVDYEFLAADKNGTGRINPGAWHELEILLDSGTAGNTDGYIGVWLNGVQIANRTDIITPPGAPTPGFRGVTWQPTVCSTPWPTDEYMTIARWAVFTSNPSSSPVCGNAVVENGEQCDTGAARGACPATCSLSCTTNTCASKPGANLANPTTVVNVQDVLVVVSNLGSTGGAADLNTDGTVNLYDLIILARNWG